MSNSLEPHGLQHTRPPCPSPTPRVYSNSCPLSRWCHPTISSSVVPFSSHLQSCPASGSFKMSQFFTSGGQSIGVSASASVLPMNIQDWFLLGWTGWISLQFKGLSRVFFNTTVQKHQFFGTQLSLHPYMTTGKTIALTRRTTEGNFRTLSSCWRVQEKSPHIWWPEVKLLSAEQSWKKSLSLTTTFVTYIISSLFKIIYLFLSSVVNMFVPHYLPFQLQWNLNSKSGHRHLFWDGHANLLLEMQGLQGLVY